jgi:hypothetical protein
MIEAIAVRNYNPKAAMGWSQPLTDAANSTDESSALESLSQMMLYSTATVTALEEPGKASVRETSEKRRSV